MRSHYYSYPTLKKMREKTGKSVVLCCIEIAVFFDLRQYFKLLQNKFPNFPVTNRPKKCLVLRKLQFLIRDSAFCAIFTNIFKIKILTDFQIKTNVNHKFDLLHSMQSNPITFRILLK